MSHGEYMIFGHEKTIENYLDELKPERVVSFVGAGGKSTLIEILADEYVKEGISPIITTTTHIRKPETYTDNLTELKKLLSDGEAKKIYFGRPVTDNGMDKLVSPDDFALREIIRDYTCPILIESDGSKGKMCKAPEEYEPVIIPETNLVIGVISKRCIGGIIGEVCHRPGRVSRLLKKSINDIITDKDLEVIFYHSDGLMKGITQGMRYIPVLRVG